MPFGSGRGFAKVPIQSLKRLYLFRAPWIIYPIDYNGDPHGLWQFIVHLKMNVGRHNMP